jgi:hypothetical protein
MTPLMWQLAAIQGMRRDQIAARIRLRTFRALKSGRPFSTSVRRPPSPASTRALCLQAPGAGWPEAVLASALDQAAVVAERKFRFVNAERDWSLPVDWQAAGAPRLWRFHLHYFDDAPALALAGGITGETKFVDLFYSLALDWLSQNATGAGDGWHPYPISRRIPNWIYALGLSDEGEAAGRERIRASLEAQAQFLARHLEFDALGNHLLANARALLFAGAYFRSGEAGRWWATAERILEREVAEQFLADGGHFERSPMYHALVLQDLLECAALFHRRGHVPAWLAGTIERADWWLGQMLHPDGGVALFNDCTLEGPSYPELAAFGAALRGHPSEAHRPGWRQLAWFGPAPLSTGRPGLVDADETKPLTDACDGWGDTATREGVFGHGRPSFQWGALTPLLESGYFLLRDTAAGHALIFDAGEPCPSYIPAHAHADLLSYELSLFGRRVIVDSGVCEYEAGPWRDYCRSTRAHNTVQVDGLDQSELWGSFRAGRRAHPMDVHWDEAGSRAEVGAAHTGYRRLRGGVTHRRSIRCDGGTYCVTDTVTGTGSHRVESLIHFHPQMDVDLKADGLTAQGQGVRLIVRFEPGVTAELRRGEERDGSLQGWYCPAFGVRQPNPVVVLSRCGALPAQIRYEIVPISAAGSA